jgi:hypothetical protein
MTEGKLKGLFGGGEEDDAQGGQRAERQARRAARGDGGGRGGRRRDRSPEEVAHAKDFINRYTTGHPSEGFSSEEAVNYLRQVRSEVPPEVMQRAAVETVRNLPDDQRKAFAEMLQRRQAGSGMVTIERTGQAHAAEGRGGSPAGGGMDDMLGGLFGGLFGGGATQPDPYPQPRQSPQGQGGFGADDMLGGLLGGLLGGGMTQQQPRGHSQPDNNPFDDLFGGLFGGGDDQAEPRQRQQRQQPQAQGGGVDEILSSPLGKAVLGGIAAFAMKEMMDRDGRL